MLWKNKFGMINRKWFSCFWDGLTPPMREVFRGVGRFQLEFQLRGSQYHSTEAQEKVGCSLWAVSTTAVARQNRRLDVVRLHNWTDEHCWSLRYHLTMHISHHNFEHQTSVWTSILPSSDKEHGMENTLFIDGFPTYTSMFGGILRCHMWFFQRVSFYSWYVKLDVS